MAAADPCTRIARYHRPQCGQLLGADHLVKLGAMLHRLEGECPHGATAVRLILLTGCRPGEIRRLRRHEIKKLDDATLSDAAERVALAVRRKLKIGDYIRQSQIALDRSGCDRYIIVTTSETRNALQSPHSPR